MATPRILHLVGSPTNAFNRELSELYARGCLDALDGPIREASVIAHISPDGTWRFPRSLDADAIAAAPPMTLGDAIRGINDYRIDIALPQMFCRRGMTDYRALLEVLNLPYLGNRPLQMALSADKAKARAIVAAAGVRVPRAELVRDGDTPSLPPRTVVKPVDADNSEGVTLVTSVDDYPNAIRAALAHADAALVEDYIPLGREVRCGVIERDGALHCLPIEEYRVDEAERPIRRRDHKLKRGDTARLTLAAKTAEEAWIVGTDDPVTAAVHDAARTCHIALGCRHYSLFDFRIDPRGQPWFLEAGLYCSYAPDSVVVTMMAASGVPLDQFLAESVADILVRPANR